MKRVDDDYIDATLAGRALTRAEGDALVDAQSFMERGAFTATRRSRALAIELLAGGAVAVVVIGLILALARFAPQSPRSAVIPPTASPTATPTRVPTPVASPPQISTVPLHVIQQLNLGTQMVNMISVSPQTVWVAVLGAFYGDSGRLLRIDARSARQTASWLIGGDPTAIAAAGAYVWVANSFGDASRILPEQNTVEQFNATTGALVHIYRVMDPRGLIANANSALVISAPTQNGTALSMLTGGTTRTFASVSGGLLGRSVSAQSAVAVCASQVYLAVSDAVGAGTNVTIYAVPPTGGRVRTIVTIPNDYMAAMTCDGTSLFITAPVENSANGKGGIIRVNVANGRLNTPLGPYPLALASVSGRVWVTYLSQDASSQAFLTSVDAITGAVSSTRSALPPPGPGRGYDPYILVPGDSGLWLVAGFANLLIHVAVG